MAKSDAYVIGASGHGKVVASTLVAAGYNVAGFFDDDDLLHAAKFFQLPVIGGKDKYFQMGCPPAVVGIGNADARKDVARRYSGRYLKAVHTNAYVHSSAKVGVGSVIFAGSIVQPDTLIGEHAILNTGSIIDHDCWIGNFVHICPGVSIAGNVTIRDGAWIGIGAQVIQGISIGEGAVVGAGATVIRDVPDNVTVVGTPARISRY